MAFSLKKFDIPEETKKEIMEMYSSETDGYDTQLKELTKRVKTMGDYDTIKTKVTEYEAQIATLKETSSKEVMKIKKEYAYNEAIKKANVSNDKLVKKLLNIDELNFDDAKGEFVDFDTHLKTLCDEYGIEVNKTSATESTQQTQTVTVQPSFSVNKQTTTEVKPSGDANLDLVMSIASDVKARKEINASIKEKFATQQSKPAPILPRQMAKPELGKKSRV